MSQTADRYAKALFELSQEQNNLEAVENSMTDIKNLIMELNDFRLFLSNPILSYEERSVVLKVLFEGKVSELVLKFLLFITYKRRLGYLKNIIGSFDRLYLNHTNQLRVYITTALPVTDLDKVFFNQRLCDKFQHKILTKWSMDSSLIGGFRIFLQDKIYDYSFKDQLNNFFQQATQAS